MKRSTWLALRLLAGLLAVGALVGGAILLSLDRSSDAGRTATTNLTINAEQAAKITQNSAKIDRLLRCLSTAKHPIRCLDRIRGQITSGGGTGRTGRAGLAGVMGAKGDKGERGATGATGPRGAKGDKGDRGTTPATSKVPSPVVIPPTDVVPGPPGPIGPQGDTGPQGPPGPQGEPGKTVVAIETACPNGLLGGLTPGWATDPDGDGRFTC